MAPSTRILLAVAASTCLFAMAAAAPAVPQQIHLYLTGATDEMMVSYVTQDTVTATFVKWGLSASALPNSATGTSELYAAGTSHKIMLHEVKMTGLPTTTATVFYQVGADSTWSAVLNFTANPNVPGGNTYAMYADFGLTNDVSLDALKDELDAGSFQTVIHAGDFAYDLHSMDGLVGDWFLEAIAPISSHVPYMGVPGNHEEANNFTQYDHRFHALMTGPGTNSASGTARWYSFDDGLVHWVGIDTEVYHYSHSAGQIERQLNWLKADLAKANQNRDKVPWIVMYGHKAWWMGNTNFTGFADIAHAYGVDLYQCGHVHNYLRFYPEYNGAVDKACASVPGVYQDPKYMITLVAGSPGCQEHISTDLGPADALVVSSLTYGFGLFKAINTTHATWQWVQTLKPTGSKVLSEPQYERVREVKDELTIIQTNHGPRAL